MSDPADGQACESSREPSRRGVPRFPVARALYLLTGAALLWLVVAEADAPALVASLRLVGWGILLILAVHTVASLLDAFTWQLSVPGSTLDLPRLRALWKIRLVGDSVNTLTPLAGMGGEPVKAVLLNRLLGVDLRDGAASLMLANTTNLLALIAFVAIGLGASIYSGVLPESYTWTLVITYVLLASGIGIFFMLQCTRLAARAADAIRRRRLARPVTRVLNAIEDLDDRLVAFYSRRNPRFGLALLLAFVNWLLGIAEVYFTMRLIGRPISLEDAWVVEACVQLVRAGTFYIPAAMGSQDGAYLLGLTAITGNPAHGLTVALVRRFREILWVVLGVLIGSAISTVSAQPSPQESA